MKLHKFVSILALAAIAALGGQAQASVISTTASNPNTLINSATPFHYTFDLTGPGYVFVAGTTTYTSGTLVVRLTDVNANETGSIVDGPQSTPTGNIDNQTKDMVSPNGNIFTIDLSMAALADLNADGKLAMTISAIDGSGRGQTSEFYFADATLTVSDGSTTPASVPEPTSIALMGLGLVGLGYGAKRRKS